MHVISILLNLSTHFLVYFIKDNFAFHSEIKVMISAD